MEFSSLFPIWSRLTAAQQAALSGSAFSRKVKKGDVIHHGDADCTGLLLVRSGQLRAFILSEDGREITIYRLFERDLCLFSAACMLRYFQNEGMVKLSRGTIEITDEDALRDLAE